MTNIPDMHVNPEFLARILGGGLVLGGGAGLVHALLRQNNAILNDNSDEDTIPVDIPVTKQASMAGIFDGVAGVAHAANSGLSAGGDLIKRVFQGKPDPATAAAGGGGGAAGAGGSAHNPSNDPLSPMDLMLAGAGLPLASLAGLDLSRRAYQFWRGRDLRQRLKDEHEGYMKALAEESANKHASTERRGLTPGTLMAMSVLGLPLLSGLTAGMLTDRILTQQFPLRKRPDPTMRLRYVDQDTGEEVADASRKVAHDLLVHTVLGQEKIASDTSVSHIIGAVALGRLDELEGVLMKSGADDAMDAAEGCARHVPVDPLLKMAAVRLALNSGMGPSLRLMAAAAFDAMAPSWRARGAEINDHPKLARQLTEHGGMVVHFHMLSHAGQETLKKAAVLPAPPLNPVTQAPTDMLRKLFVDGSKSESNSRPSTLQSSAPSTQHSEDGVVSFTDQLASQGAGDGVDKMLSNK